MKWGEFQSVLQLATALNIAYYSLREIRSPSVGRLKSAILEFNEYNIRANLDSGLSNLIGEYEKLIAPPLDPECFFQQL